MIKFKSMTTWLLLLLLVKTFFWLKSTTKATRSEQSRAKQLFFFLSFRPTSCLCLSVGLALLCFRSEQQQQQLWLTKPELAIELG